MTHRDVELLALVLGIAILGFVIFALIARQMERTAWTSWAAELPERLPRAWWDEAFYRELPRGWRSLLKAAGLVAAVGVAVRLPDLLDGEAADPVPTLLASAIMSIAIWCLVALGAEVAARVVFGWRPGWRRTLTALGYAFSPFLLIGLRSVPGAGLLISVAVATWTCALCYQALLGARDQDHGQTLGVTVSAVLSGSLLLGLVGTTCMLCAGFSVTGCPFDHPVKKVGTAASQRLYYFPTDAGYEDVKPDSCAATAQGLEEQGYQHAGR